jgi:putative ABC transport system permease protein
MNGSRAVWRNLRATWFRLRATISGKSGEGELSDEIAFHIQMGMEENIRLGMSPEEALRAARLRFGGVESIKESYRDQRGLGWIETTWKDIRYAARGLGKTPGFTAVAVAMLALGIGVNAAVFTIVDTVLFHGFPLVQRNDRILYITTNRGTGGVDYVDFEAWRAQAKSLRELALPRGVFSTLDSPGAAPEALYTKQVTPNIFRLAGVRPILGRDFVESDAKPGAAPTVMLRYSLWEQRFGKDPAIVGQTVRLNGVPTTVIGVMPAGFSFPEDQSLWTPAIPLPDALTRGHFGAQYVIGRMADGATVESVRTEMETIGRRLASARPREEGNVLPVVKTFNEFFIGSSATTIYESLFGAVGFVLLIACANVANLMLGRGAMKAREISIRTALGAGQWRIVRQLLVESLMLSGSAGILGWWIARWSVRIYVLITGSDGIFAAMPAAGKALAYPMGSRVVAYLIAISIGTGIVFGLGPAKRLANVRINAALKDGGHGQTSGVHARGFSRHLMMVETALAVVLLAGAGVMTRSFLNLYTADLGVNTRNVLWMDLYVPPETFPTTQSRISYYRDVRARLQTLPGVQSAGLGAVPGFPLRSSVSYEPGGAAAVDERSRRSVAEVTVSPGYFRTLGARVIAGRDFNDFDQVSSIPVAVVNERFARLNWPGEPAVGKRLRLFTPGKKSPPRLTVVGVVSNIRTDRTREAFEPLVYAPEGQHGGADVALVRASAAPATIAAEVRRQLYAIDPYRRVPVLRLLADTLSPIQQRNVAALFLIFAAIALLLATVGLYAVVAHSVSRCAHEIGIRRAIGATSFDVFRVVLRQGLPPVGAGMAIGIAASFGVNRLLRAELVRVSPNDPATLAIASALLVLFAILGCWIPARRAMRVDPAVTLRHE